MMRLEDVFWGTGFGLTSEAALPKLNILKRDGEFEVVLAVPGYRAEQLSMTWDNKVLVVKGSAAEPAGTAAEAVYLRRDFRPQPFEYRIQLPESAHEDGIQAELKDGLLTVRVPLQPKRVIPIQITTGQSALADTAQQ